MNLLTLDWETYWDDKCTLAKLSIWEYLRHPKFKIHMLGAKLNDEPTVVFQPEEIQLFLAQINWVDTAVAAHNVSFDGAILQEFYGVGPAVFVDTKSMAVYVDPRKDSYSLDACAKRDLGEGKIAGVLESTKGVKTLTKELYYATAGYCKQDVELCYKLVQLYSPQVPAHEKWLIDLTTRLNVVPRLRINATNLNKLLDTEETKRATLLKELGLPDAKQLTSTAKFAALLLEAGAPIMAKYSVKQKKMIPAYAKTDGNLQALLQHSEQRIRKLAEARVAFSGNLLQTRAPRLLAASCDGLRPITLPLNYYGARNTGRFSGGSFLNGQNLPRDGGLRECIEAPPGYQFVIADYSAIEARICPFLAGESWLVDAFSEGRDVYCEVGTQLFGRPITKADKRERFIAKTIVLGCIYGMGPDRLYDSLAQAGFAVTIDEASQFVSTFRESVPHIKAFWFLLGKLLKRGYLVLPSGRKLTYPDVRPDIPLGGEDTGDIKFWSGKMYERIHGPKACENVTQATARDVMGYHWLKLDKENVNIVMNIHDEFVALALDKYVDETKLIMEQVMCEAPPFVQGLPLATEIHVSPNYTK